MTHRTPMAISAPATPDANSARSYRVFNSCSVSALPEVATVHEHELGHRAHVADLVRTEEGAVRKHDAAGLAAFAWHPVPGDVHDAPRLFEDGVDDGACVRAQAVTDRR